MKHTIYSSFLFAARTHSYTTAAGKLGISPQAVSQNVKALEKTVGVPLLKMKKGVLSLTPGGMQFRDLLLEDIAEYQTALSAARKLDLAGQILSVGFVPELIVVEPFLAFLSDCAGVTLSPRGDVLPMLREALLTGALDVAGIVKTDPPDSTLVTMPFGGVAVVAAVPNAITASCGRRFTLAEVPEYKLLMCRTMMEELGVGTDPFALSRKFACLNLDPRKVVILPDPEAVEAETTLGKGITLTHLLSRISMDPAYDKLLLPAPSPTVELVLACRADQAEDPAVRQFMTGLSARGGEIFSALLQTKPYADLGLDCPEA